MYSINLSLSLSFKPGKQQEMLMVETQTYFARNNCNADFKAQVEKVPLSVAPLFSKNTVSKKRSAASQLSLTNTEITALRRKKERQEIYERVVTQCRKEEEQKEQEASFKEICSKKTTVSSCY
jgi:hypothetical protein